MQWIKKIVSKDTDRKDLLKSLFYLIVCSVCVFAVSLAWFHNGKETTVDEVEFAAVNAIGFQISLSEDGEYSDSLSIQYPDNLLFKPVSGIGDTLYYATLTAGMDANDYLKTNYGSAAWSPAVYSEDSDHQNYYYKVRLYFRADKPGYVTFTPSEILVKPAAEPEERQSEKYEDESGTEVEVSGDVCRPVSDSLLVNIDESAPQITKDYIAAAARVRIDSLQTSPSYKQNGIIVPNAGYHLTIANTPGSDVYTYTMTENGKETGKADLFFYDGTGLHTYEELGVYYYTKSNTSPVCLLKFSEKPEGEQYYKGWADVTIWIEGYDEEANENFAGGEIACDLTFRYVEDMPETPSPSPAG